MKLGFSSCCYPHRSLLDSIPYAAEHGFDFVECTNVQIDDVLRTPQSAGMLADRLRAHQRGLSIHHALPQPNDEAKVAAFRQSIRAIHAWISANPGLVWILSFDTWVDRQASLPLLLHVLERFKDMDLPVATEDYPLNSRDAQAWRQAMAYPNYRLLSDLAHTNVRLCDTGAQKVWCLKNEGENLPLPPGDNSPQAFEYALRKKPLPIAEIHVHNNNGLQDQHLGINDGTADFAKIVPVLKKIGFDGLVNIEITPTIHGIHGVDADKLLLENRDIWNRLWNDR